MSTGNSSVNENSNSTAWFYGGEVHDKTPLSHLYSIRLDRLFTLLGDISGSRVLDVGCGPGMAASGLLDMDCDYYGVDLDEQRLVFSRSRFVSTELVHLAVGNMEKIPYPDSSFDVVLCLGALEYVKDVNITLKELSRVVKKDGIVIITMQNEMSPYRLWERHVYSGRVFNLLRRIRGRENAVKPLEKIVKLDNLCNLLAGNHLEVSDVVFYDFNLWLKPLDRCFPKQSYFTSTKFESLYQSPLRRLGTGFIIKIQKRSGIRVMNQAIFGA